MNTYNLQLGAELACLSRAIRAPIGTQPAALAALAATGPAPQDTLHRRILAASNGDNTLIQSPRGRIAIHEIFLWNPTDVVDLEFFDGPSTADFSISLLQMPAFAISAGFTLGYAKDPHFIIREGNPFVLSLSLLTTVTGFIKYRIIG
jgi:hypothetical protein